MSQLTYRYNRLDEHYQRLVEARSTDDVRAKNSILNLIIVDCWAIGIAAVDFLERKDQEVKIKQQPISAKPVAIPESIEYRCTGCGTPFGSKQARGAHSKFCNKGGIHD
jgi:SHS2 domain-containing protein